MRGLAELLRRHVLVAGFAAAALPLVALLGLQYVWLSRLEAVTALAHRAALQNSLEAIDAGIQDFYRAGADRALSLRASLLAEGRLAKVADLWRRKPVQGARRLFLVDFTRDQFGNYFIYDEAQGRLVAAPASDEALAVIVACTPWQVLSYRGGTDELGSLRVDERDPENRILLRPITDSGSAVVGVAGMILDEEHFKNDLLPGLVAATLPRFFPEAEPGDLSVMVRDAMGRVVLTLGSEEGAQEAVRKRLPFVFSDWTLVLNSRAPLPERWARASFIFNMALAILLAVVLIGGITLALRTAERAMRLSEMKSDFVSNVSHELRTPLASIRVFAELLRTGRTATPEKVQEYADYIEAESRRLSRLIDNILDFSRIESGRKTYQFVPSDLEDLVAATLRAFEMRVRKDGFRVTFERPQGPLPPVPLDPDAIGQALHNLLDNAVKYSDGAKEIGVRLGRAGGSAVIAVRDGGVGIPREEQRKIFDRFHRVSTGLVHDVKGTGLGLSIVHHIVRAHRGDVTLESEPGKGSTFTIRLPIPEARPAGRPIDGEAGEVAGPRPPGGSRGEV